MEYTYEYTVLQALTKNNVFMGALGKTSYDDLSEWYKALGLLDKLNVVTVAVNNLENIDRLFNPITVEGSEGTTIEKHTKATMELSTWDVMSASYRTSLKQITVLHDTYGVSLDITLPMFMNEKETRSFVDDLIGAIIPAYRRKLREGALKALMTLADPATDLNTNPGYWRKITNAGQELTPYDNGMLTFTSDETHYLYETLSEETINNLVEKIRSKGYGESGVRIVASDRTWKYFKKLYDKDELETLKFVRFFESMGEFTRDPNTDRELISLPDSSFPFGYFLAWDPSVKGLYKRIPEKVELQGLVPMFRSLEAIELSKRVEYKASFGFGVVIRGFGAVTYIGTVGAGGALVPPTSYVSPMITL